MEFWQSLLIVCYLLDLLCIITVIFFEHKSPPTTIAWVLVLVFLPLFGFVAYAMFGSGFHVNKKKKYAMKKAHDLLYNSFAVRFLCLERGCRRNTVSAVYPRLIDYLQNEGEYYYSEDNAVEVFTDGNETFERMKEDMRRAEKHIHLLYYIFRNDQLGREIVSILTEKAAQGLQVRVIYDSLGSMIGTDRLFDKLRAAGGQAKPFSPLFSGLISSQLRLNYRNHRKITVVDGRVAYLGGMNIGDEYLGKDKKLRPWRDTHMRITGTAVGFLQNRFLMDWVYVHEETEKKGQVNMEELFPPPLQHGGVGLQIVSSGPDTTISAIKNGLLELIYAARNNIYIQTPYFTPDASFIDALHIAAKSGVDVRVMLPGKPDHLVVQLATMAYARQARRNGVKIYAYDGFLHAKTIVIDGRAASIGTANIGNRSFALNFEVNAFIYDRELAGRYEVIFERDMGHCAELSEAWFDSRPALYRGACAMTRMLAPLM